MTAAFNCDLLNFQKSCVAWESSGEIWTSKDLGSCPMENVGMELQVKYLEKMKYEDEVSDAAGSVSFHCR